MTRSRANATETDGSEALCLRDLSRIETHYGRLVYLAALRNPDNGRYEHYGSTPGTTSNLAASRSLKQIHEAIFKDWVLFSLERKKLEIETYIQSINEERKPELLIDAWLRLEPYRNLVPAAVQGPDRQRHISDIETILGLLKNVYGVGSPDQTA